MASLKLHRQRWQTKVRIPKAVRGHYEGREFLYRHFATSDRKAAQRQADLWEAGLRIEWAAKESDPETAKASLREVYERLREVATSGQFEVHVDGESDPVAAGIDYELEKMADAIGPRDLTATESARVAALQDALAIRRDQPVRRRPELEPTFKELADDYMRLWRIAPGRKETNTEQQKVATFDLFASYFGKRPIRQVTRADASAFVDALRQLDPNWARTGKAKADSTPMTWRELQKDFGGRDKGLSDATVNRHMGTLSALWKWAEEREHCEGRNPFDGHRRQLKSGRNKNPYVAWEADELTRLFKVPPSRTDLTEVMVVAMFTGMRLNEIVSLTFGQIRKAEGVEFIDITEAKTDAGIRQVPLHPRLSWLSKRAKTADPSARIWPKFTAEGPGGKPGGDAGKEFSRFKAGLGFTDRRKVFHSFRKNVVGQLERARVPENEVAQLVGHAKQGFTFGTYGDKTLLQRRKEIVDMIDYPGLILPCPSA